MEHATVHLGQAIPNLGTGPGAVVGGPGLGSLFVVLVAILGGVLLLAVVGVLVILIVANRADPDASGRRPLSVYLFAMSFVTLLTSVVGSVVVVASLVQLIGSHPGVHGPGLHPVGDAAARGAVLGGLITVISLVTMVLHLRRGLAFAEADGAGGPSQRVARSYVAAVGFLAVLTLVVALVAAIYLVCQIAGPGVFGSAGGRVPPARNLITALYTVDVALVVLWSHRNLTQPGLSLRKVVPAPPGL